MCGYLHYYGVFVLIIAKGDGFVNGEITFRFGSIHSVQFNLLGHLNPSFDFDVTEVFAALLTTAIFIYFWFKQYESNMTFINLRKNKTGAVVTETHLLPKGGLFKYLSSPHMTCEVGMYAALYILLHQNTSYIYCLAWVVTNQFSNALLTHRWYKETFSDYPKERKAFIPFVI